VATAVAHGINMFRYPYYENDEAVYLSQAWSVLHGKLAPYTYWYDHAPLGWFQLAGWLRFVGGLYVFGTSVNGGRVVMVLLHMAAVLFTFRIAQRLTGSSATAFTAAFLLAVTPLGNYYMRRVLLDNIMLVWVLLSIDLLLQNRQSLWRIVGSGVALAIAMLTKETAAVFLPITFAMVVALSSRWHRRFAVALWSTACVAAVSTYPLMALLKQELFPTGSIGGGSAPHVSLLSTLVWQLTRPGYGILDVHHSLFWEAFAKWWQLDPVLLGFGLVASAANLVLAWRRPDCRWAGLLSLSLWLYLLRGGMVLDFYITPALPLLAVNIAVLIATLAEGTSQWLSRPALAMVRRPRLAVGTTSGRAMLGIAILGALLCGYVAAESMNPAARSLYLADQTTIQRQALEALRALPANAVIAMDNYGYLDLHFPKTGAAHPYAHWYWKLDGDPEIRTGLLHGEPGRIDYVLVTPQVTKDLEGGQAPIVSAALKQSMVVRRWLQDSYGVELWQVRSPKQILRYAWESYLGSFVTPEGRVLDPQRGDETTSEGQAYALLRAVWMDDPEAFDRVWVWTQAHLRIRGDALLAWHYGRLGDGSWGVLDRNTASDADQDTALALLFAGRRWHNPDYLEAGKQMVSDIWKKEVGSVGLKPYLVGGDWAVRRDVLIVNPSYLAPYAYRIFAEVDPAHPWEQLIETSYALLEADASQQWNGPNPKYLPTEWVAIDAVSGRLREADPFTGGGSRWYSFGAARVAWRLGLDLEWNAEPRAKGFLQRMTFLVEELRHSDHLFATYSHDGTPIDRFESRATIGAALPALAAISPKDADRTYRSKLFDTFIKAGSAYFWSDPLNYYEQNWAWFGTAAYGHLLPTFWPVGSSSSVAAEP
jgi:endo-1,4-beta-D-glucanase Y/4-amino-4-deoxy-L-arabinose transferase-like glycosyltransferase